MEKTTIKGAPVIEIYESFDGSYWFVTEKAWTQDSVITGKVYENDQILFGYVRLPPPGRLQGTDPFPWISILIPGRTAAIPATCCLRLRLPVRMATV
jgi:hypothetical protein